MRDRHRILLTQGRAKFGDPSAAIIVQIDSIKDLDRLERMSIRLLTANNWAELLATE